MFETHINLIGHLVSDVKFAISSRPEGEQDLAIAKFRVASTPRKFDKAQNIWVNGDTMFATVVCFRRLAEHVTSSLKRGDPVLVYGKMRTRTWQGDRRSGTELEIIATAVGHNLVLGTSMFSRSLFRGPGESAESAESAGEFAGEVAGSDNESLFLSAADAQAADRQAGELAGDQEPATPVAAVTPLPGVSDIRSVGAVDATGVLPTRPSEERSSPQPASSNPSTTADEQAA